MSTPLTLTSARRPDGRALVTAVGEIDMSNSGALATALDTAREGGGGLVLDLTAVEYLDSAGLSVLFAHADHLELIAPHLLEPVLTLSGLPELATVRLAPPGAARPGTDHT
ncbi:anti-anti-sigma regulatory factor [Actinomadura coerulea]|uniref:Anti-anti-sigma regulatory factor n=1 Tax=Actinomadura coerulea TaxID=46159 RepID=A0A7X0KX91_9ACTN|nr:STAS domain-containing protein [Actinomadura coerulea]MBB6394081.1 anti-anti-sigma regulatory factor [Actinomadura coerulea]GGQ20158.1 anti-anti-sigma factor [Actinomadura coerulea]